MAENSVIVDPVESSKIDSPEYHNGSYIGGCRIIDPISSVENDVRSLFDFNKVSRSTEVGWDELNRGSLIDISFRKSSNSVNTPYRIVSVCSGEEKYNGTYNAYECEFKLLLEPVIQNASLVIISGFNREFVEKDHTHTVFENVYYKHKWDSPMSDKITSSMYPSELFDLGFEEKKDKQLTKIFVLYDELISSCLGLEHKLVPAII